MALPEVIVICMDTSSWMTPDSPNFKKQLDAIEYYCKAKLKENPDTVVGLYTMGDAYPCFFLNPPTGSLTKILDRLKDVACGFGPLNLRHALSYGCLPFTPFMGDPNKIRRSLLFVGGLTNLSSKNAQAYGKKFIKNGVVADVVNFYLDEPPEYAELGNLYGRSQLEEFVSVCNPDNGHIVDVLPDTDICQLLSRTILKETTAKNDNHVTLSEGKRKRKRKTAA